MVTAGPDHPAASTALQLAQALLQGGHQIVRLFFYRQGVLLANRLTGADHLALCQSWQKLIVEHQLDAVVCVSAALRRGVVDADESARQGLDSDNLAPGFQLGGLGQWADALVHSDRSLSLGP